MNIICNSITYNKKTSNGDTKVACSDQTNIEIAQKSESWDNHRI